MDGNDRTNRTGGVQELSPDFFNWLREINVNWVGLSAELHVTSSLDSTVERVYTGVSVPAFKDEDLIPLFREFNKHGINVYLTLNFDPAESRTALMPMQRYQMGCPEAYLSDDRIKPENWPWALEHPDHDRFAQEFWRTYTEQAVHFAQLAQQEGVALFSLGTETDCLFHTRPDAMGQQNYSKEIIAMVQAVREVYDGPLTYDQHYEVIMHGEDYQASSLWEDAGLDYIGISAYFPLIDTSPVNVMSVEELETIWDSIFKQYLVPLHERYPEKTILFTEFGYTASLNSPYKPWDQEFVSMNPKDRNGNGLDDGQEVQANIYRAFFNTMKRYPGVLGGAFLWGNYMASDEQWSNTYFRKRGFDIRWKLSENVVREQYCEWIGEVCTSQPVMATVTPWPTIAPAATVSIQAGKMPIYMDGLANGWQASSYLSKIELQSVEKSAEGRYSIKVATEAEWGAVKLTFQESLDINQYQWLVFQLNPGDIEDISLSVTIFLGGKNLTYVFVEDLIESGQLIPGQWTKLEIPMSVLNPENQEFDSFFFELGTRLPGTFFLDDISLVGP